MSDENKNGTPDSSQEQSIFQPQLSNNKRSIKMPIYDPNIAPAPGVPFERRKKKDWACKTSDFLAAFSWVFVAACVAMLAKAQPKTPDFFSRIFNIYINSSWDFVSLRIGFFFLLAAFIACIIGVLFRALRHKRKTDKFSPSFFMLGVISIAGMIIIGISIF